MDTTNQVADTASAVDESTPELDVTTPVETTPVVETKEESKPITKSLRDVIAEQFDKADTTAKAEPKTALPKQDGMPAAAAAPVDAEKHIDPISGRVLEPIKAPAGMPPAIREKWGGLDRTVQQYWTDRERDIQQTLSKTDNERKLAGEFKEIAAPYEPMLRQFNLTASQHAKELFNLSYTLNTGTPQTKAQVIYNLINHFKPDPQALQALFAGQPVQPSANAAQQPINVQAEVEKALEARKEQEERTTVESAVSAFAADPAHEFYADVAPLMGKIIDAGLVDGKDYTELFKNAYELACQRQPEIKQILDSRAAARTAPAMHGIAPTSVSTAKPVPSVKPSLNGGARSKVPTKAMSVREAAMYAWDAHEGKN